MELSTLQLINFIKQDKLASTSFIGVFARDQLPTRIKYPCCFIVNTDKSDQKGEHWLAFYYDKHGNASFFDSFGNHPSYFKLDKYLSKTASKWNYNTKQLQSYRTKVCGYYCVLFILYLSRGHDMKTFVNKFKYSFLINDFVLMNLI